MHKHPNDSYTPGQKTTGELDCFGAESLLEAYLDGELSPSQQGNLERHLHSCESCTADLTLARRIQSELRDLPIMSCPPAVSRAVLDHAEAHPSLRVLLQRFWNARQYWQPAFALLVVTALGLGYWRAADVPTPVPPAPAGAQHEYTAEEIAQAEAELKLALAYLGDIGERARVQIGTQVGERVIQPLTRSIAGALLPIPLGQDRRSGAADGE